MGKLLYSAVAMLCGPGYFTTEYLHKDIARCSCHLITWAIQAGRFCKLVVFAKLQVQKLCLLVVAIACFKEGAR